MRRLGLKEGDGPGGGPGGYISVHVRRGDSCVKWRQARATRAREHALARTARMRARARTRTHARAHNYTNSVQEYTRA